MAELRDFQVTAQSTERSGLQFHPLNHRGMGALHTVNALTNGSFDFKAHSGRAQHSKDSDSLGGSAHLSMAPPPPPHSRFLPAFPQIAAQALSPFMEALTQTKVASGRLSSFSNSSIFQVIQASSSELLD